MKRNLLFALLCAGLIGMFFIACDNGGGDPDDPIDNPAVSISGSSWSDALNPETTLLFSAIQVTLSGDPSGSSNKNWYWGTLDGQSYPYDLVEDEAKILELLDKVEANWGTDYTVLPDAVIVVWTDPTKNIGFQLHYYAAGTGKNYERLICWGIDPAHEFKRDS